MKQIDPRQLKQTLRTLGVAANEQFPELNSGGCCVFASIVGKHLIKKGIVVEVITISGYTEKSISDIRNELVKSNQSLKDMSNWSAEGVSFGHVAIRFRLNGVWYTYDSDTLIRSKKTFGERQHDAHPGAYTVDEAAAFARTKAGWNPSFDRRSIPSLRKLVAQHLR